MTYNKAAYYTDVYFNNAVQWQAYSPGHEIPRHINTHTIVSSIIKSRKKRYKRSLFSNLTINTCRL